MNPDSPISPIDSEDRFLDAVLHERARLGPGDPPDSDVVEHILAETIHRGEVASQLADPLPGDRRLLLLGGVAAAAICAGIVAVLSVLPFGNGDRHSDEIQLVVRYGAPASPEIVSTLVEKNPPLASSRPYDGPFELLLPSSTNPPPRLETEGDLANPFSDFGRSVDTSSDGEFRRERFRVTAEKSAEYGGRRIYSGNVRLHHGGFEVFAETVTFDLDSDAREGLPGPITATNVRIRHDRRQRVARAEHLRFDPPTGAFILSGVTGFESIEGSLPSLARDDRLVLTEDSFAIRSGADDPDGAVKYANPLPLRGN